MFRKRPSTKSYNLQHFVESRAGSTILIKGSLIIFRENQFKCFNFEILHYSNFFDFRRLAEIGLRHWQGKGEYYLIGMVASKRKESKLELFNMITWHFYLDCADKLQQVDKPCCSYWTSYRTYSFFDLLH